MYNFKGKDDSFNEWIYITRQMGESEALYKILPSLRLKDSNVTTIFVPTNKKENRSKFLMKVEEKDQCNGKIKKRIENKDGWFVEKYDIVEKYVRRDKKCREVDNLSASQFWKMYGTAWKKRKVKKSKEIEKINKLSLKKKRKEDTKEFDSDIDDSGGEFDQNDNMLYLEDGDKFNFVMEPSGENRIPLPEYIELD